MLINAKKAKKHQIDRIKLVKKRRKIEKWLSEKSKILNQNHLPLNLINS
jgi:hypothetical protein